VTSGYTEIHQRLRTRHAFVSRTEGIDDGTTPPWIEAGGVVDDSPMTSTSADRSTNLPDLPFLSAAFLPTTDPFELLLACDGGVLRGVPNADTFLFTWQRLGPNLPIVSCQQLVVDASNALAPIMRLATYGRSAWELEKPSGPRLVLRGSLGFGEQPQTVTAKLPLTLHNVGDAALQATLMNETSGDFKISSFGAGVATIAPGGSHAVDVEFTPTSLGASTASFTILTDDPLNGNVTVTATGIGVTPGQGRLAVRAVNLRFGLVLVGTTAKLPFAVTNRGTGEATISGVTVTGSPSIKVVPATHFPLSAKEREIVDVEFTPTANGVVKATITITSTGGGTLVIDVTGEGTTVAAKVLSSVLNSLGLAPAGAIA
jgi:Abnormal spindle-like microcephaly-assoc'd, ASPM-SPD-2-Hydin